MKTSSNRCRIVVLSLLCLLVGSNAFWVYAKLDAAVGVDHREVILKDNETALSQTFAVIKALADSEYTKSEITTAAGMPDPEWDAFEKDDYLFIGRIGLKFSKEGRLVEAVPAW